MNASISEESCAAISGSSTDLRRTAGFRRKGGEIGSVFVGAMLSVYEEAPAGDLPNHAEPGRLNNTCCRSPC